LTETIITLCIGGILIPSVAWLVREVLALKTKLVQIEEHINNTDKRCGEHREWLKESSDKLDVMGRDIARICTKMGITEEKK
jgi:hypothetical protein